MCHVQSLFNQKGHPSFFYCNWDDKDIGYLLKKISLLITMLFFLTRSDKKDIMGRNICEIRTKVLIWNINQQ